MKKTKSTESFLSISALSNYEIIKTKLETGEFQTVKNMTINQSSNCSLSSPDM